MDSENITREVLAIVIQSGIVVPKGSDLYLYHHLGWENFHDTGAAIIECYNREYCKKYIILLPGQTLPVHAHKVKEETFTLLWGDVEGLELGDTMHVEPVTPHSLRTNNGAVVEEISTRYLPNDSRYMDPRINENENKKTKVRTF